MAFALDEPDGLLAWGGDLSPTRLLNAYRQGIFPWFSEGDPILWWSPARRCVIPSDAVYRSRRLERLLRQEPFTLTADTAFDAVVASCGRTRGDTWITEAMARAYGVLHELGHAHSIEAWQGDHLVGGLYGVSIGRMFFGESMFSGVSNASKVILVRLGEVLQHWGYPWIDGQVASEHLLRQGAIMMDRETFTARVDELCRQPGITGPWTRRFREALQQT
ncbi:MAG: leucyl/phenylalanyl-tRNA--protein transferase [Xanthomonadales bacterium]|nr:leucyl/phenylalanyl-tRNA--protein transferase [Xanthomonadales bacterium]